MWICKLKFNFKVSLRDVRKNSSDRMDCCDGGSVTDTSGLLLFAHFQLKSKGLFWHEGFSTAVPMNQRTVCPNMPISKLCYDRQPYTNKWNSQQQIIIIEILITTQQISFTAVLVWFVWTLWHLYWSFGIFIGVEYSGHTPACTTHFVWQLRSVVRLHPHISTVAQYWQNKHWISICATVRSPLCMDDNREAKGA